MTKDTPIKTDLGFADVAAVADHVAAVRAANRAEEIRIAKLACKGIHARTPQPHRSMEDELRQDYPILYTDAIAALEMPSDERGILGQAAALALLAARLADKMEQKP